MTDDAGDADARPVTPHASGLLIEIAGIDGSGKSTLANAVEQHLCARGLVAERWRVHSWVRKWANGSASRAGTSRGKHFGHDAVELAVAFEYMKAVRSLQRTRVPTTPIIAEPFVANTAAIAVALGVGNVDALLDIYVELTVADVVLFLDLEPEIAMARIAQRDSGDVFLLTEKTDPFIHRLAHGCDVVANTLSRAGKRVVRLDGRRPVETSLHEVINLLDLGGSAP